METAPEIIHKNETVYCKQVRQVEVLVGSEHEGFFSGIRHIPYKEVPIVINNFNRLTSLKKLIGGLESRGYRNIHIIDNASSYPPLLEYYSTCPYPVYMLHKNVGHLAVWETGLYKMFTDSYFAYTDSDLEIFEGCPDNFMEKCYFRTASPYCVRHLPWYEDSSAPGEEDAYYAAHLRTVTHWSGLPK